ncbi:MAG: MarR family transcriptional regulator [Betaproteobacteria bacterium]|jgi:MarR family transcriptional regulator, organic hydroperoxide resistance regulator|nr:MarR family transcriptional regulator [Betaproteobacteria bacterium]NBP45987.1 MarR family transcriptional regulator [Betaproteobacteria bacterium]
MSTLSRNNTDDSALVERLSFLIHTMSTRIALIGSKLHRDNGINHFTARILVLLLEHEELRVSDLVDLLMLPQSTLSSHLLVLQKKGLIRRRRSRKDSRSVFISLSAVGLPLAQACDEQSRKANIAMLAEVDEGQRAIAFDFLRHVSQRLDDLLAESADVTEVALTPPPAASAKKTKKVNKS